jgi:hypothetical protein
MPESFRENQRKTSPIQIFYFWILHFYDILTLYIYEELSVGMRIWSRTAIAPKLAAQVIINLRSATQSASGYFFQNTLNLGT